MLQVSTDYVFNGRGARPYREDDIPDPVNAYGASKLEGERQVREAGGNHLIVRVQSLYGRHGHNFVRSILRKLEAEAPALRVVGDQVCSPTYTRHLAQAILALIRAEKTGVVHVRASGECTWHEFAAAIAARVRPGTAVHPVPTSAYPTPARRPAYAVMDCRRYREWTGRQMPHWREGLDAYLREATEP